MVWCLVFSVWSLVISLWVCLDWVYCCWNWNWKLKTENWKYCSKIIFKCVNSIVRLIFNIFLICEQYINSAWTVNLCEITVHVQEKKKKKGNTWNWKRKNKHNPNTHYSVWCISLQQMWSSELCPWFCTRL